MIEFDLERALAGDELVTREGLEVKDFKLRPEQALGIYPYMATLAESGLKFVITEGGKYYATELECKLDLFMKHEKSLRLNIAPFDLKKALAGHALVDSTGCEYDRFAENSAYNFDSPSAYRYEAYEKGTTNKCTFTAEGEFVNNNPTAIAKQYNLHLKSEKTMKEIPFNLEFALVGDPVIKRNKKKIIRLIHVPESVNEMYKLISVDEDGTLSSHNTSGRRYGVEDSDHDLLMAPKKVKYYYALGRRYDTSSGYKVTASSFYTSKGELINDYNSPCSSGGPYTFHEIEIEE